MVPAHPSRSDAGCCPTRRASRISSEEIADVAGRRVRVRWGRSGCGCNGRARAGRWCSGSPSWWSPPWSCWPPLSRSVPALCADADTVGRPSTSAARADMPNARRRGALRFFLRCPCPCLTVVMPNLLLVPTAPCTRTPRAARGSGRSLKGVGKKALAATWQIGKSRRRFGHCGDGFEHVPETTARCGCSPSPGASCAGSRRRRRRASASSARSPRSTARIWLRVTVCPRFTSK